MASLTKVSIIARKIIRYSIYFIIIAVVARYSIRTGIAIYKRYNPEPPPPPSVGFGKLTTIPFPDKEYPEGLSYTLETPEGGLPDFPDQLPVYFMPKSTSSLNVVDQANRTASSLGFGSNGEPLAKNIPNLYIYKKASRPQTLQINIITGIFSVSYDLDTDRSILQGIPPREDTAITEVKQFLGGNMAEDIRNGRTEIEFLRTEEGETIPVDSISEAEMTKVNFFRRAVTFNPTNQRGGEVDIQSTSPNAVEANVWFNVASGGNVVNGEYHYYPIEEDKMETYPMISAQTAFDRLKSGDAYLANLNDGADDEITIRRIYMAYYDAGQYTDYYQPVVVFEGDDDFYAYIPAVTSEYYGE